MYMSTYFLDKHKASMDDVTMICLGIYVLCTLYAVMQFARLCVSWLDGVYLENKLL